MNRLSARLSRYPFHNFGASINRSLLPRQSCTNCVKSFKRSISTRTMISQANMDQGKASTDYSSWSNSDLIARVTELEIKLKEQNASFTASASGAPHLTINGDSPAYRKPPKAPPKSFDQSKYTTRLIALKFAYLGQGYNGFEHHANNSTPLPTIEEELWKALVKTKLIFPTEKAFSERGDEEGATKRRNVQLWDREEAEVNWDGCEYSKCGRTDRGVSAFGQVIGIRVRSNRRAKRPSPPRSTPLGTAETSNNNRESAPEIVDQPTISKNEAEKDNFDPIADELPYIQLLNRVLPPSIRILAWCPNPPPNFSARFSCKERRYKYFFTNPCFAPVPGSLGLYSTTSNIQGQAKNREGWLEINSMREACKHLVGLHDFRNFCKLDPSKQITNFRRRIFHADIEEISLLSLPSFLSHPSLLPLSPSPEPKLYAFVIHGSAFLWHQVRSIAAILFLVGQGLESPSLIPQLLDISANPCKPKYEMATDAPLVLWDCIFPSESEMQSTELREHGYEDALDWIYVGERGGVESGGSKTRWKWGRGGIIDDMWEAWRAKKMDELVASQLLDVVAQQGNKKLGDAEEDEVGVGKKGYRTPSVRVFDGGDVPRLKGTYVPVLQKERMEPVEVINEKYAKKKGWDAAKPRVRDEDADE